MGLNDTLLTIIRILYIVLLVVLIFTAVEGAKFVHETRTIVTTKLENGEIFKDLAAAGGIEMPTPEMLAAQFAER